ncbi:ABC transporter permease [Paenibacillus sp. 1001270B_150601_E10]|uniref:ABC transporter permease n=1 Tax=Paenibacillus sp. 1001270B_150601_E10 TaxID=2787079 RepID=UPI00189FD10E|nr:ABC transporter permease [Paenibacillus sp. 1001270B_150601_E10]
MKDHIYNFLKYKDLFFELIKKDIKLKYRNSVLGILWSMLNPLLMMIVLTIIFSNLFNKHIEHFPVYVLTGRLIYQFFSESTNFAMDSIGSNSQLIKKVYVPKYLFPLSRICSSFITTLISMVPLLLVMLVTGMPFHWLNLLAIFPMICLLISSVGIGLLLATINVFFKDMKHLYSIILTVIMYLTPIFYPASIIPDKYRVIVEMNPIFNVVVMFRNLIMEGTLPPLSMMGVTLFYSCCIFVIGFFVFYKKQDKFIFYI